MSFAQIKDSVVDLSREERLELAALITHLNREEDPEFKAELDRRLSAMDAGERFTIEDLDRLHANLSSQGK